MDELLERIRGLEAENRKLKLLVEMKDSILDANDEEIQELFETQAILSIAPIAIVRHHLTPSRN